MNADNKLLETVFVIAICCLSSVQTTIQNSATYNI